MHSGASGVKCLERVCGRAAPDAPECADDQRRCTGSYPSDVLLRFARERVPSSRQQQPLLSIDAKSGAEVAENLRCMLSVVLKPKRELSDEFRRLEQALETLLPAIDKPGRRKPSERESDRARGDWNLSEITIFLIVILTFVVPIFVAFMMYGR